MFGNSIKMVDATDTTEVVIIDLPSNRRTVRSSTDGVYTLSIAHQESTENGAHLTQRSNVRLAKRIALDDTDATVTAYAQLTLSIPKDHITEAQTRNLVNQLVNFLQEAENAAEAGPSIADNGFDAVTRLYAGEP